MADKPWPRFTLQHVMVGMLSHLVRAMKHRYATPRTTFSIIHRHQTANEHELTRGRLITVQCGVASSPYWWQTHCARQHVIQMSSYETLVSAVNVSKVRTYTKKTKTRFCWSETSLVVRRQQCYLQITQHKSSWTNWHHTTSINQTPTLTNVKDSNYQAKA